MQIDQIPLDHLSVSKANMRSGKKPPDFADILPTIIKRGVIVPLIVRPNPVPSGVEGCSDGHYEVVAGKRRYFASLEAAKQGQDDISLPCIILHEGDDADALEISMIENMLRQAPDPVTQWESYIRPRSNHRKAPSGILGAVRALAYRELGDNHDYVMALHTDTDRPHVHLAIEAQGDDRRRFNPGREELHRFREQFAIELRKRGIEASATPRRARGVGRSGSSMALRQIRDRHVIGSGVPARDDIRAAQHSVAVIRGQASHPAFVTKAKERWASISEAYMRAVAALERTGANSDRDLAGSLEAFVTGRPAPEMMPEILMRAYERQMAEMGQGANLGIDVDMNGKGGEVSAPPKTPPSRTL